MLELTFDLLIVEDMSKGLPAKEYEGHDCRLKNMKIIM